MQLLGYKEFVVVSLLLCITFSIWLKVLIFEVFHEAHFTKIRLELKKGNSGIFFVCWNDFAKKNLGGNVDAQFRKLLAGQTWKQFKDVFGVICENLILNFQVTFDSSMKFRALHYFLRSVGAAVYSATEWKSVSGHHTKFKH